MFRNCISPHIRFTPKSILSVCAITLLFCAPLALSQKNQATINTTNPYPKILALNWLNEQFLIKQRNRIEAVSRRHFGKSLEIGKRNIPILQRIVNEELIPKEDKMELQALGVLLGDAFVEYDKTLVWQVYEDLDGKSHAVCVSDTEHCLFPVTMLSRRIEAGATVNVQRIYEKGLDIIKPVLPKRAYF